MLKLTNRISSCLGIHRLCVTIYSLCTMSTTSGDNAVQNLTGDDIICRRLSNVTGVGEKQNDIIYCRAAGIRRAEQHVLFFGGDVQDYPENMAVHPVNKRYSQWNLEQTGLLLQKRFPKSAIYVIKATKMHLNTFSVYSNFVESNDFGVPSHQSGCGSWRHLKSLYDSLLKITSPDLKEQGSCSSDSFTAKCDTPLILVAFSKGCIVLNQLLYDLKDTEDDPELSAFVKKVKEFYWLDGGHSGGSNTWVKSEDIVRYLSKLDVKVWVHVTPYQVKDPMRAWIGKEERQFVKLLKKFGVTVHDTLHFESEQGSLENHFRVLTEF